MAHQGLSIGKPRRIHIISEQRIPNLQHFFYVRSMLMVDITCTCTLCAKEKNGSPWAFYRWAHKHPHYLRTALKPAHLPLFHSFCGQRN